MPEMQETETEAQRRSLALEGAACIRKSAALSALAKRILPMMIVSPLRSADMGLLASAHAGSIERASVLLNNNRMPHVAGGRAACRKTILQPRDPLAIGS